MGDGSISVTHSSGTHASSGSNPSAFIATKYTSVANPNALPPEANVQDKYISDSFSVKCSTDAISSSDDKTEDLDLPSPSKAESSTISNALNYGTYKDAIGPNNDLKSLSEEKTKVCKALVGDCNCPKCYDSSGFYWG